MGKRPARIVNKPWGREEIFAETERYAGKILTVNSGESLSLQYHVKKEETIRILKGRIIFETGRDPKNLLQTELGPGDVFHIPPGLIHRMEAVSDCEMLEVSTADLDDVVRLSDRYGREGTSDP